MANALNEEQKIQNALFRLKNNSLLSKNRNYLNEVMNHPGIAGNKVTPGQVAEFGVNAMPFVGDAIAIEDAKKEYQQGNYGWSAFNALTALPVIGDMATAAKMTIPAAASLGGLVGMMYRGAKSLPEATGKIARQRGIIGGVNAKTADLKALRKARIMNDQGVPREQIWAETGWFKGVDDKWRFEIDDSQSATNQMILDGKVSDWSMGQFGIDAKETMAHTKLYNAYPELGDIKTQGAMRGELDNLISGLKGDTPSSTRGFYSPKGIGLNTSPENMRSTMLHELQHGAQDIEDFARGGNSSIFSNARAEYNVHRDQSQELADSLGFDDWQFNFASDNPERYKEVMKEGIDKGYTLQPLYDEFAKTLPPEDASFFKYRMGKYEQNMNALGNLPNIDPQQGYKRLSGEAESRAVQARMNLTPDERAARPFWLDYDVPEQDQLVRFGMEDRFPQMSVDVDDYGMAHRPAGREVGASLDDLSAIYPDDIYGSHAAIYYGHYGQNNPMDVESVRVIQSFKGRPNQSVTIYRAVPYEKGLQEQVDELVKAKNQYLKRGKVPSAFDTGKSGGEWYDETWDKIGELQEQIDNGADTAKDALDINNGDWVTINRRYAKEHGEAQLGGKYKILKKKVKAKDIFTQGDSIHEWGYNPE